MPQSAAQCSAPKTLDCLTARQQALSFDWQNGPQEQLGALMARADIDQATAFEVFLNGKPQALNYRPKADLTETQRHKGNLLDAIAKRINCGFYLPEPGIGLGSMRQPVLDWLQVQDNDQRDGRAGRWCFTPEIFKEGLQQTPNEIILKTTAPERPRPRRRLRDFLMLFLG